jgi:RecB family exonuclease
MRLLLDLPEEGGYFRPLADQPQMAVALWSTLRELRMAGVRAANLKKGAFASAQKHAELCALVAAYESFLASNARGDMATVFDEAILHLDWCPIQPDDCWIEHPDVIWPPLQRRLIDRMPGTRIVPAAIELPGLSAPRRLGDRRVDRQAPRPDAALAFLTRPEDFVAGGAGPTSVSLFHAGGPEAEVEEVFRRILASGRTLDQVEIACASPQYSTLIWEKAMRYEWPVTIAQGIPAAVTRPGRALLAMTEWVEDDFAAGRLRRMLQSGDVRMDDDVSITPGRASRLLVKSQAAWGRDTYRLALGRLAKSSRARAKRDDLPAEDREGLEKRARQAEELSAWIDALIAAVPVPDADGRVELTQVVDGACAFVERVAARASALDALAAASLASAVGELRALGAFRCPLDQALRFLRERVESLRVGADRPRPGHLHVSWLTSAAIAGRPVVFVVGLEEGRVFPMPFEDPVLLDAERRSIDPTLAVGGDRTEEAVYAALSRLAAMSLEPGVTVALSFSCRDLREYRDTYASWVMLQAYRVTSGNPAATYKELHAHLGVARSCVPEVAAGSPGESRWWLHGAARVGAGARADVCRQYPSLERGAAALAARASNQFTEFDGHVPAAGAVLDPCRTGAVVSPTQLEDAAGCPFRYFLRRGLGIEAIEAGERDRDVWIDHLLRGSLLHDLYAELLRRCRAEKRRVTLPGDHDWLQQRGTEMLATLAIEMPPPSHEVREREARLFLHDLALFSAAEAALDPAHEPVGFEVAFGRADSVDSEPLAQPDPVIVDLGGGLALRIAGRIDRVDRVGRSTYRIVDYKTGSYWADGWKGTFAGGTRLQHALYGLAAVELLRREDSKARVSEAEYYFTSARGHQERKRIPTQPLASVAAVLSDLRAVILSGAYVHAAEKESCKFCHYGYACGGDAAKQAAARKHGDAALVHYLKLVAHE